VNLEVLDVVVAVVCLIGILGTILPILPGTFLVAGAVVVWGVVTGGTAGWGAVIAAVVLLALATGLKYLIPAKWMRDGGVGTWVLLAGGALGIVGFFVIPVVGVIIGFVLGVYLAELIRLKNLRQAWPTTVTAMKAAGLSTLIEFTVAVLLTVGWFVLALRIG